MNDEHCPLIIPLLSLLHAGPSWSGAGEGDARGVAAPQDGSRRQEGAGRKGHEMIHCANMNGSPNLAQQ